MEKLAEIVNKRSTPGILIFDMEERLLYANAEATSLMAMDQGMAVGDGLLPGVPQGVLDLCRSAMAQPDARPDPKSLESACTVVTACCGDSLAVRAFCVARTGRNQDSSHVVVLVEREPEGRIQESEVRSQKSEGKAKGGRRKAGGRSQHGKD